MGRVGFLASLRPVTEWETRPGMCQWSARQPEPRPEHLGDVTVLVEEPQPEPAGGVEFQDPSPGGLGEGASTI
eukprot:2531186-Rhodomonas_salina.2